jgi:dihydrofolate reductase
MPIVNRIYLTRVQTIFPNADTFFEPIDSSVFELVEETPMEKDEKHAFAYTFQIWERKQ